MTFRPPVNYHSNTKFNLVTKLIDGKLALNIHIKAFSLYNVYFLTLQCLINLEGLISKHIWAVGVSKNQGEHSKYEFHV